MQKSLSRAAWNLHRAKRLATGPTWVEGGGESLPRMAQAVARLKETLYPGGKAVNDILKIIQ